MSNWFQTKRLEFIRESLCVYGFIRRDHLMRKFGISMPQASKDLRIYVKAYPDSVSYNLSTKRYESDNCDELL
jgi:hypothetical protein